MGVEIVVTVIIGLLLIAWVSRYVPGNRSRLWFQLLSCFVILGVFFCFRDIGVIKDTCIYYTHTAKYDDVPLSQLSVTSFSASEHFEYLYQVVERFVYKYLWHNGYCMILTTGLLILLSNFWMLARNVRQVALCLFFLFLYLCELNATLRQAWAIAFFFAGLYFLQKQWRMPVRLVLFYAMIAVGFFFHKSILITAIVPLALYLRPTIGRVAALMVLFILVSIFVFKAMAIAGMQSNIYYQLAMTDKAFHPYAFFLTVFTASMLLVAWIIAREYDIHRSNVLWWCALLCIGFQIIYVHFAVVQRLARYFEIFPVILFVGILFEAMQKSRAGNCRALRIWKWNIGLKWVLAFFIALMFLRMGYAIALRPDWLHLYPYAFYDFQPGYHAVDFSYSFGM